MTSIVLIGMRGAGKSSLGLIAAETLGREFIDLDEVLEREQGESCSKVVERVGWPGFRKIETEILKRTLNEKPKGTVISCGGGIVESESAREILMKHSQVVLVYRPIEDIVVYLDSKISQPQGANETADRRPGYGESITDVWKRRKPYFFECCTLIFPIRRGESNWTKLNKDFSIFIRHSVFEPTLNLMQPNVAILQKDISAVDGNKEAWTEFTRGFDGVLLHHSDFLDPESMLETLAVYRDCSPLPLFFDASSTAELSICAQCNIYAVLIDREIVLNLNRKLKLPRVFDSGFTRCVLKISMVMKPWSFENVETMFRESLAETKFMKHRVRGIVLDYCTFENALDASTCIVYANSYIQSHDPSLSLSLGSLHANGMGTLCASCLCLGTGFTLAENFDQVIELRVEACKLGLPLQELYCLFGSPILMSPSPTMHNCGFNDYGLCKHYCLCDTLDVETLRSVIESDRFRGASVTIPHKEVVHQFCNQLSDAAREIGAVNTLIKSEDGSVHGDNTDWRGIYELLSKSPRLAQHKETALVVGAGGTALAASYCVKVLGMQLLVYNRTYAKAHAVAQKFGGTAISSLEDLKSVDAIISTIPAASEFTMPNVALLEKCKPVVFDAAYRPRRTKLLEQAAAAGCETLEGIQMLIEQGLCQFKLWTGLDAPREKISEEVLAFYES